MRRLISTTLGVCFLLSLIFALPFGTNAVKPAQAYTAWAPNTAYAVNALVTYNARDYKALQAHTSLVGWEPPNVPALWQDLGPTSGATATPTKTNTPAGPTPTPSRTPTKTNTPVGPTATPTSGGGTCWAAWVAATAYTGGAQVSRNGQNYQAAYWTQGNDPATNNGPAGSGQPWIPMGSCGGGGSTATPTRTNTPPGPTATPTRTPTAGPSATPPPGGGKQLIGYFAQWGIYSRAYYVKNIETSGSAAKLTIINYAFGNIINNRCSVGISQAGVGDAYADYQKAFDATTSVDGVADTWNQALKGNWNQLRKLKAMHPNLKVVISLGGWTWSDGFYTAAQPANRAAFVASCIDAYIRGNLPFDAGSNSGGPGSAAGVFDGIDLDWEYPGICGNTANCGASAADRANFVALLQEFRTQLNAIDPNLLLTIAVGAGSDKMPHYDVAGIAPKVNYINLMTYDFFGAWATTGPTAFHSALYGWNGMPATAPLNNYYSDYGVQAWKAAGAPANKLLLGIGFYGRGWTGVTNANNGLNQPATGPAPGTYEQGIEDYKVLKNLNYPAFTSAQAGTAWIFNGSTFWSYDTPATITTKMNYAKAQGLAGAFAWELDGDDPLGTLLTAMFNGLK